MGFTLSIGQLKKYKEDGENFTTVKQVKRKDAPRDGSPTDGTNERWPSYSGWALFCEFINVDQSFFVEDHPGFVKIDKDFQKEVHRIYNQFQGKDPSQNGRLEWLKYWTDWAIDNCKNPVFHNS